VDRDDPLPKNLEVSPETPPITPPIASLTPPIKPPEFLRKDSDVDLIASVDSSTYQRHNHVNGHIHVNDTNMYNYIFQSYYI